MHYKMKYYHFSWLLHLSYNFHFSSNFTCSFSFSVLFLPMFLFSDIPQPIFEECRSIHVYTMENLVYLSTSLYTIWSCWLVLNQQPSQLAVENYFVAVSQVSSDPVSHYLCYDTGLDPISFCCCYCRCCCAVVLLVVMYCCFSAALLLLAPSAPDFVVVVVLLRDCAEAPGYQGLHALSYFPMVGMLA